MNQPERNRIRSRGLVKIAAAILAAIGMVLLIGWLRKNSSRLFRGQGGFTLIETVIAVVILAAIGTGVLKALDTNARGARTLDEQVQATNLVTAYLENMRQLSYDDNTSPYPTIGSGVTIPSQYSVNLTFAYGYSGDGININWSTTNNSGEYKLQKVSISVLRTGGKLVLTTCTYRTKQ